ncbi:MAG: hypothetical protein HQK76_17425 [Desulfobacterales bacterium]|nr:hypothetical protein [Desulfobacterales bacterium]
MYQIYIEEFFPYPVRDTFEATTKEFDPLQKYIPNLTLLKTVETKMLDEGRKWWNLRFHGDSAIPAVARPIIKPSMLRWTQHMVCDHNEMTIEWKIITDYFTEHIECSGMTYYHTEKDGTKIEIDGNFSITLEKIPGIPSIIVRKAVAIVEPFIGRLITPNMKEFYSAIKKRIKEEKLV